MGSSRRNHEHVLQKTFKGKDRIPEAVDERKTTLRISEELEGIEELKELEEIGNLKLPGNLEERERTTVTLDVGDTCRLHEPNTTCTNIRQNIGKSKGDTEAAKARVRVKSLRQKIT